MTTALVRLGRALLFGATVAAAASATADAPKTPAATSASPFEAEFNAALRDHIAYVGAMLQVFLDAPDTHDAAKLAVLSEIQPLLSNTGTTVAYEYMVLQTKGKVCKTAIADSIPGRLQYAETDRAPVMFLPGSLLFVNPKFFRDMCVLYQYRPDRIRDLYAQHIHQIKASTGGKRYDELNR